MSVTCSCLVVLSANLLPRASSSVSADRGITDYSVVRELLSCTKVRPLTGCGTNPLSDVCMVPDVEFGDRPLRRAVFSQTLLVTSPVPLADCVMSCMIRSSFATRLCSSCSRLIVFLPDRPRGHRARSTAMHEIPCFRQFVQGLFLSHFTLRRAQAWQVNRTGKAGGMTVTVC
jgi:hypothetical protein